LLVGLARHSKDDQSIAHDHKDGISGTIRKGAGTEKNRISRPVCWQKNGGQKDEGSNCERMSGRDGSIVWIFPPHDFLSGGGSCQPSPRHLRFDET
jgi:hypothetical protein